MGDACPFYVLRAVFPLPPCIDCYGKPMIAVVFSWLERQRTSYAQRSWRAHSIRVLMNEQFL